MAAEIDASSVRASRVTFPLRSVARSVRDLTLRMPDSSGELLRSNVRGPDSCCCRKRARARHASFGVQRWRKAARLRQADATRLEPSRRK